MQKHDVVSSLYNALSAGGFDQLMSGSCNQLMLQVGLPGKRFGGDEQCRLLYGKGGKRCYSTCKKWPCLLNVVSFEAPPPLPLLQHYGIGNLKLSHRS